MGIEGTWLFNLNKVNGDEIETVWSVLSVFDTGEIVDPETGATRGTYRLVDGCFTAEIPVGQEETTEPTRERINLILVLEGDFKENGFLAFPVVNERPPEGAKKYVAHFQRVGTIQ
jgi:hypothetical protein